jgi:hypothetical protein
MKLLVLLSRLSKGYNKNTAMSKQVNWISDLALFLAGGLLAASVSRARTTVHRSPARETAVEGPDLPEIRSALCNLEKRVAEVASTNAVRFAAIETRIEEHAAKLGEIPAIQQIIFAVEETLTKTMAPLTERLSGQEEAITRLKTAVGRSDRLIDRVLELAKQAKEESPASQTV